MARMGDSQHDATPLHTEMMAPELCTAITQHYDIALQPVRRLTDGEECETWLTASDNDPLVVRLSPAWRSPDQLAQTHAFMLALQSHLPIVVAPLRATDGTTFFLYHGRLVGLFPFVEGQHLIREEPAHRAAAARLLADLHRTALAVSPAVSRPQRHLMGAAYLSRVEDPGTLSDPELDAWHATLLEQSGAFTCGMIHGDYYRRNLLARGDIIVAVLDWDNAHPDFLMQEVASSTWEFCKNASGDDWYPERVRAFLQTYREAGGPCQAQEYASLLPFIRWRLREEIRYNLAMKADGLLWEPEYVEKISRAFQRFRNYTLAF